MTLQILFFFGGDNEEQINAFFSFFLGWRGPSLITGEKRKEKNKEKRKRKGNKGKRKGGGGGLPGLGGWGT